MFEPAPGWAIVRVVPPGQTAGGIHIPETDPNGTGRVLLVRASRGHFKAGVLVPCEIPVGSRLLMLAESESASSPLLPQDHAIIQLHDVLAYEPPAVGPRMEVVQ